MLAGEGSVCENLNLPVNEYVACASQIPIVSRKISDRDGKDAGEGNVVTIRLTAR